jgi:cytochrome c oxidase subunit 2
MNIDLYEKIWMGVGGVIIVLFLTLIGASTFAQNIHPPSHIETIDPSKVFQDSRFSRIGTPTELPDGTIEVQLVAVMFAFVPNEIHVPAGRRIRFRMTSADVTHGFMIAGTNVNTMLVPGYISQFTTSFAKPGDYLVVCHELCGNAHHIMHARVIVNDTGRVMPEAPAQTDDAGSSDDTEGSEEPDHAEGH